MSWSYFAVSRTGRAAPGSDVVVEEEAVVAVESVDFFPSCEVLDPQLKQSTARAGRTKFFMCMILLLYTLIKENENSIQPNISFLIL